MNFQPKALLFALGTAVAFVAAPTPSHAQIGVNIQLGHPNWGPVAPAGAQYYYVPEIDGYYDLQAQNYIVQRNGRWNRLNSVPGYDPRSFHPVVVDYRGRQPWDQYRDHHTRYFKNGPGNRGGGPSQGNGRNDRSNGHDNRGNSRTRR